MMKWRKEENIENEMRVVWRDMSGVPDYIVKKEDMGARGLESEGWRVF